MALQQQGHSSGRQRAFLSTTDQEQEGNIRQGNFVGEGQRRGGGSASTPITRHKVICSEFLHGSCSRMDGTCKYEHPPHLANAMKTGGANANVSNNRKNLLPRPLSRPPSPTGSRPLAQGILKSSLGKRTGSPLPSNKIRFGKAYHSSFNAEGQELGEEEEVGASDHDQQEDQDQGEADQYQGY